MEEAVPNLQLLQAGRARASAASAWLEEAPEVDAPVAVPVPAAVPRPFALAATPPAFKAPPAHLFAAGGAALPVDVPVAVPRPLAPPATPPAFKAPPAHLLAADRAALPVDAPVLQQNVLQVSFERPPGGSVTLPPPASFTPSFAAAAPVSVPLSRTAFRHLVRRVREASHRLAELGERLTFVMQTVEEEDRWHVYFGSVC